MGFRPFDYLFKSDPFKFNFRLLAVNGFWPLETRNRYIQVIFSIFSLLCCFSPISMLFIQLLDLYLLRNDPFTLTKNMCATSITIACVVKHLLIFNKVDNVESLYARFEAFGQSRSHPDDLTILQEARTFMKNTTKALYSLAIPCITVWMLYPGLEASDKKSVPFPYRLPTEDWSTPVYEILYTYQSLSMVGFMVMILSNDLIYYGMVIRINAQYDILILKLRNINAHLRNNVRANGGAEEQSSLLEAEKMRLDIKNCVMFHQNIIQEISEMKGIYSMPYLVHFLSAVTLMGVIIIDVVVVSKQFKLQMLQRMMYTANGVFDTFLCCFFTTLLEERSYKLRRAVYSVEWYRWPPEVRKDLLMILMRTKKAPTVKVGNHFILNLATFLQVSSKFENYVSN